MKNERFLMIFYDILRKKWKTAQKAPDLFLTENHIFLEKPPKFFGKNFHE